MSDNPKGRILQSCVAEVLDSLPPQAGNAARVKRSAATIVMRFQQAERRVLQAGELVAAEHALAMLNQQLVQLRDFIHKMPEEARWILDSDLRDLSDDFVPAQIDEDGRERLMLLEQSSAELSAMVEATSGWAASAAAGKGPGGNPGATIEAAVADAALLSFERLMGATVGKNPEGKKVDGAFVDLVRQLFELFNLKGKPRYHALCAVARQKALVA